MAILFNNNFEYEIIQVTTDEIGNYLAIDLRIEKYNIFLINIYGPNRDSPAFYENIQSKVENFYGDFVVIGGDFNLVQETSLDYHNYKLIGNPKARKIVLELIEKLNLKDPWRSLHDDQKQYTWFGPSNKKSRIDFCWSLHIC